MGKPELLEKIFIDFDDYFWCEQFTQIDPYLDIVFKSLTTYEKETQIQRRGRLVLSEVLSYNIL